MKTETITWNELPADGVPDADTTVLVAFKFNDEPGVDTSAIDTWPAWWDGEHWMDAATGDRMERHGDRKVLAWSDMPAGGAEC